MDAKRIYLDWCARELDDPELTAELRAIAGDDDAIFDRFYRSLDFGTAGLRGVIGAGTNRMNIYTVRLASRGLADSIGRRPASVAIAYDSRKNSEVFAKAAAEVFAAAGITAHLYPELMPTPMLSFAVRDLGCDAGVVITASHNPAKYNGYKAYGPDGCQMTEQLAGAVYANMQRTDMFAVPHTPYEEALRSGGIRLIGDDLVERYYRCVLNETVGDRDVGAAGLKLVYTPLCGAGNRPVRRVFELIGLRGVTVVPEQERPDPTFATCPYPNPEIREALELGLALAERTGADLLVATDPDADRVGIAVRAGGEYKLLSGNEVGALLLSYIIEERTARGTMPRRPVAFKSIVTTDLARAIGERHGVEVRDVMTGFKYIGEQIAALEAAGEEDRFILGFEESYGYLPGGYVRDKDAVVGAMLICQMAAHYKRLGSSLYGELQKLYAAYGTYLHVVDNFTCEGAAGFQRMAEIMQNLRATSPRAIGGHPVTAVRDYVAGKRVDTATGEETAIDLPSSNALGLDLRQGSSVVIRPSGTEPKIKVYYTVVSPDADEARAQKDRMAAEVRALLGF